MSSGNINIGIPENNPIGVSSTLVANVPSGASILSLSVTFNIQHPFDSDLVINLKAPNGQVLNLARSVGGGGDNFVNTIVSSTASVPINLGSAPFTGTFLPSAATVTAPTAYPSTTSVFSDLFWVPSGSWTFAVADVVNSDIGLLQNWAITINYGT